MPATSLRERKKAKTRNDLKTIASRLFQEQGYDTTTVEQICEEAMIAVNTLFRYYKSKEDLALAPEYDNYSTFREQIEAEDRTEDTLSFLLSLNAKASWQQEAYLERQRFISSVPALAIRMNNLVTKYQDLLADGFARDNGKDPDTDVHSIILAAMYMSGIRALFRKWINKGATSDLMKINRDFIRYLNENHREPADPNNLPSIEWESSSIVFNH